MPIRESQKSRYPANWKEISYRIRFERAKGLCEWSGCLAPHGELIFRLKSDPEEWRFPNSTDLTEGDPEYYGVKIVLTVAHKNHTPEDCREENLVALCQLHHLRLDAEMHKQTRAETRRAMKNNLELFARR